MTLLGCRLSSIPETFGWDGLLIFLTQLPITSAFHRAVNPELHTFASPTWQSLVLANIWNNIAMQRYEFASANSKAGHQPKKPQMYPTPWNKEDNEEQVYGKGAIPIAEFDDWYYSTNTEETIEE